MVVFGQMMVALVFSELSVVYPLAGALYQWARRLGLILAIQMY